MFWYLSGGSVFIQGRRVMIRVKKELIVVGDRVLLTLDEGQEKTKSGLYLPASVREKDKVAIGTGRESGSRIPHPESELQRG